MPIAQTLYYCVKLGMEAKLRFEGGEIGNFGEEQMNQSFCGNSKIPKLK